MGKDPLFRFAVLVNDEVGGIRRLTEITKAAGARHVNLITHDIPEGKFGEVELGHNYSVWHCDDLPRCVSAMVAAIKAEPVESPLFNGEGPVFRLIVWNTNEAGRKIFDFSVGLTKLRGNCWVSSIFSASGEL